MLKPVWWMAFLLLQVVFIAAGLTIIFWVVNTWDENHKLDAIFGAGLGSYGFLFAWKSARRWAIDHISLFRKDGHDPKEPFDPPIIPNTFPL
jgi:ribokinase